MWAVKVKSLNLGDELTNKCLLIDEKVSAQKV